MTQNNINTKNPVLQVVTTSTSAAITCSTAMLADNSIPQNTEGDEVLTLSITPKYSTSTLEIVFTSILRLDVAPGSVQIALFQDSTAGAISAISLPQGSAFLSDQTVDGTLRHYMTSGTTSSTTFKVRVGPGTGTTDIHINADASGTRLMGGVSSTRLTITEYR